MNQDQLEKYLDRLSRQIEKTPIADAKIERLLSKYSEILHRILRLRGIE